MNKKDLLDNIRDYSPKEIADAIRNGVVTLYELKSGTHGQFTPMLQRQVKQKLENPEEPEPETQTEADNPPIDENIFTTTAPPKPKSEPKHDPNPFRPSASKSEPEKEPFKPSAPDPTPVWPPKRDPEPAPSYQEYNPQPFQFDRQDPMKETPKPDPQPSQSKLIPCPECGHLVSPRATECPMCGMPLNGYSEPIQTPSYQEVRDIHSQPASSQQHNSVTNPGTPTGTPKCLKKFSWGGFCFGWLWGVCNGVTWSLIALLFGILAPVFAGNSADEFLEYGVPTILWIAIIVINFTLGFKGNKMAWESKKFANAEVFDTVQTKWKKAAFIVYGIALGLIFLIIIIGASL